MKHEVCLSNVERAQLTSMLRKGVLPARKVARIHVLLLLDEGKTAKQAAAGARVCKRTAEAIRRRYAEGGVEDALNEHRRVGRPLKLTGEQQAHLIALACSQAPEGRKRWTLELLAERFVQLQEVDSLSDDTVRRVLKKTI